LLYICFCRIWIIREYLAYRHDHAGGTEAALQTVVLAQRLLDRMAVDALDRGDPAAIGLRGEHGAGLDRDPVEFDRTGTALGRVAAHVGAGEPQLVPQEVHEQGPSRERFGVFVAIDRDRHGHFPANRQPGSRCSRRAC
jgi:hypothetical protein